ncbi:MAG: hypothetical protein ABWY25_00465 [Paenisporosarcina sp.]
MPTDAVQNNIEVGSIVNVRIMITAIGGTTTEPTVTGTTIYEGFDGNADSIGPVDAIQVVEDK